MKDSYGRVIDYVRLSITDRCNLRCEYCMPLTGMKFLEHDQVLTCQEIQQLGKILAGLGIKKIKITGGEPLVRKDIIEIVSGLKSIDGIENVTLTTNGILLPKYAASLKEAGIDSINVSLDTLDKEKYHRITRLGSVDDVLLGIQAAKDAGIKSVKVNSVVESPMDEANILSLVQLAKENPIHIRFIEMMPIGLGTGFKRVTEESVKELLEQNFGAMTRCSHALGNGPAHYYNLPDFQGKIGFISAVGHCFCSECNRIRVTASGVLKTCLHADKGSSILEALREKDEEKVIQLIQSAVTNKPEQHHFNINDKDLPSENRMMSQIGG